MTIGHLCYAIYSYDNESRDPEFYLQKHDSIRYWCKSVRASGISNVTVVQRFHSDHEFKKEDIRFKFIKDGTGIHPTVWHTPSRFHACIRDLNSDIVHVNGGVVHLRKLRRTVGGGKPIVWQHHGGFPDSIWKRKIYEHLMTGVNAFFFSSNGIADAWKVAGIVNPSQMTFEIMEGSTVFNMIHKTKAQLFTGMKGSPVFLWVGRLDTNKDPLTVLDGFARITSSLRDPHLYMIYRERKLLDQVQSVIRKHEMSSRVHLLGEIPHSQMNFYYSSADYFFLGSHCEGSGYALIEALSCGVQPIVTDIPSFRTVTQGKVGGLWIPGNALSFGQTIVNVLARRVSRNSIRTFFERNWSYQSIAKCAHVAYLSVLDRSRSKRATV